jgi:hypothetical protein
MEAIINISKTECVAVVENCEDMATDSERMKIIRKFKCCGMKLRKRNRAVKKSVLYCAVQ